MELYGGGKLILAPMVRVGTLPARLLALKYGAGLVYSPETVDKKLEKCSRRVDSATGCIDYLFTDGQHRTSLVFRTLPREKERLILQLGTADPDSALRAALLVQPDVSGIDVNCGCPKRFSTHAGMGSALLRDPNRLCSILQSLVSGQPLPVSAKIRLLQSDLSDTISLVRRLWETGISALTVHGRTPAQRYEVRADWEAIRAIRAVSPTGKPVILNGDLFTGADFARAMSDIRCDSVMLARAAQNNMSVFKAILEDCDLLPLDEVTREYLALAVLVKNPLHNTRYCLIQAWAAQPKTPQVKELLRRLYVCKSYHALGELFSIPISVEQSAMIDHDIFNDEDLEKGYTAEQQDARLRLQIQE